MDAARLGFRFCCLLFYLEGEKVQDSLGHPVVSPASPPPHEMIGAAGGLGVWHLVLRPGLKRAMDLSLSSLLLLILLPVFGLIAMAVAAHGGSVLFVHWRVGRGGRCFGCLKFRTMHPDSDRLLAEVLAYDPAAAAEWRATRKLRRDPRITRIGRVLRATSMDELPQLINVARGEMSLVGPRPITREELDQHYAPAGAAADYLSLRPGLTGPWQVSGRSGLDYSKRIAMDCAYARNPSLRKDLVLLASTVVAVFRCRGAY